MNGMSTPFNSMKMRTYSNIMQFYQFNYEDISKMYTIVECDCSLFRFVLFCYINRAYRNPFKTASEIINCQPLFTIDEYNEFVAGRTVECAIKESSYYHNLQSTSTMQKVQKDYDADDTDEDTSIELDNEIEQIEKNAYQLSKELMKLSDLLIVDTLSTVYLWED
jgi:hypothetical protein